MSDTFVGQIYKVPLKGKWHEWTDSDLREMPESERDDRMAVWADFTRNRLKYYLPHCDGLRFINDHDAKIALLTKGNQYGGTSHGAAWSLVRVLDCDPDWYCFKDHGVEHIPFRGNHIRLLIATNDWTAMEEAVWPEYQKLMPREELGPYAPNYGDSLLYPEEAASGRKPKVMSFKDGRSKRLKLEKSKVELFFRAYSQKQSAYESTQFDVCHLDEQIKHEQWVGVNQRGRTRPNFQVAITGTFHHMKDRSDTGANSWIAKEIIWGIPGDKGESRYGKVSKYKLWCEGVPDALMSPEDKKEAYNEHVLIPQQKQDRKAIRSGIARYYGGVETSGDLVLDAYEPNMHIIPPFKIPKSKWTLYRGTDHGTTRPTAVAFCAVSPWSDLILFNEYYETNRSVAENVVNILKACGNTRQVVDQGRDEFSGARWPIWEEVQSAEVYEASVLDCRSFASSNPDRGGEIGRLYNENGFDCTPAAGYQNRNTRSGEGFVDKMRRWFEIDEGRIHIMKHLHDKGMVTDEIYEKWLKERGKDGFMGAPRFYAFSTCTFFQMEVASWQMGDDDKPEGGDDHIVGGALKYIIGCEPGFYGGSEPFRDGNDSGDTQYEAQITPSGYAFIGG